MMYYFNLKMSKLGSIQSRGVLNNNKTPAARINVINITIGY